MAEGSSIAIVTLRKKSIQSEGMSEIGIRGQSFKADGHRSMPLGLVSYVQWGAVRRS